MAITFPVPLARFSDLLFVDEMTLHCPAVVDESQTAAGEIIRASRGATLWQGSLRLKPSRPGCSRAAQGVIDMLTRPGASFLLSPKGYAGPAGAGTLAGVASNNRDVTISGLPAGLVIPADAYLSFTYGSNPVRHAFHQVVFAATANSSGTATVEVGPIVRPGWAAGAAVQIRAPFFKAVIRTKQPGAFVFYRPTRPSYRTGDTLDFIQALR